MTAVFQIAINNLLSFGMPSQPISAVAKQLLHFVFANPVVFIVVQHGDQHVQMRQQVVDRNRV